jgi:hypothetical protein
VALALIVTEAPKRSRRYCYAVDSDQALEVLDALSGFAQGTPGLAGAVKLEANTMMVRASGATLSIESGDRRPRGANGRGWSSSTSCRGGRTPATTKWLWVAIISSLPKRADSRLLVLSMAGSPTHPSARTFALALMSGDWRASTVPGPCPWWSQADVAATREALTPAEFGRYIQCEWVDVDETLTAGEHVDACVRPDRPILAPQTGVQYVAGLDIGTRRDLSALVVAHKGNRPSSSART